VDWSILISRLFLSETNYDIDQRYRKVFEFYYINTCSVICMTNCLLLLFVLLFVLSVEASQTLAIQLLTDQVSLVPSFVVSYSLCLLLFYLFSLTYSFGTLSFLEFNLIYLLLNFFKYMYYFHVKYHKSDVFFINSLLVFILLLEPLPFHCKILIK